MATVAADRRGERILTLDLVRGVAVLGILAMNIVGFAMPQQAYGNPLAYGTETAADLAVYAFNFVFVDGKMRGLFSFLFGASMLLVAQLAEAKGDSPTAVTVRRQLWLLLFGMIHFYLIWYGDILIGYALIGLFAWLFHDRSPRGLLIIGIMFLVLQFLIMWALAAYAQTVAEAVAGPSPTPADLEAWQGLVREVGVPSAAAINENLALYRGPWTGIVEHQLTDKAAMPFVFTLLMGWETLAFMLFGMAALKSGFLAGRWSNGRYAQLALLCLAISIPAYVAIAAILFADNFAVDSIFTWMIAATVPLRPIMVVAYAALIILATRGAGWLVDRIAAAGRAAFTNYLGTSLVMTGLFYGWGFGLYGSLGRAELYLVVITMWALMLLWSKPWLDRFNYGPFEWLWRSLARWKIQPMRRGVPAQA